ncbi:MAG: N-acetylmuramoyl-L-alanine amidase [Pseudobutyrivibrio sp.]|nr:N-acetylmuramoyl-L-alanine amidase [Pseudobutyrivibrio sp.]
MTANIKTILQKNIVVILLAMMVIPSFKVEAKENKVIVIDPSGQETASKRKEPIGPGAFKSAKDTNTNEYDLNLQIALKAQDILTEQGYTVMLTRTSNDVDISKTDRAMIANTMSADVFVVIDGTDNAGVSVVCQTDENPYSYGNYSDGRLLSDTILGSVVQTAGVENVGVVESDDETAINWCSSPTAIVEIGANSENEDYQQDVAKGIANGIESYFVQK